MSNLEVSVQVKSFEAVVLAAGAGTRLRSAQPKALVDLCGRPLSLWPVQSALAAGARKVLVVEGPSQPLKRLLPEGAASVVQEVPNGSGGALRAALGSVASDLPLVVLCGDVPLVGSDTIQRLVAYHLARRASATVLTARLANPEGYGRVVRDGEGLVERIVETKGEGDASEAERRIDEVNAGIYVFSPGPLRQALARLDQNNAQGELYLTQTIALLRSEGLPVAALEAEERVVLGVNDRLQLAQVRAMVQEQLRSRLLRAGVDLVGPETVFLEVGVKVEPDARIGPYVQLRGATEVARGAEVGPAVTAVDAKVGEGARVRVAWLEGAVVGPGATVGPFAYLRPGSVLEEGAKAGTYVELKAAHLGRGARVPHLSYVGDAEIGEGANLGASTITANYDGFRKHRTKVGAGARLGVDTTLVAPVEVGTDAYTGAGSVITEDVPPGALAVARAKQRTVDGYAARRAAENSRTSGEEGKVQPKGNGGGI